MDQTTMSLLFGREDGGRSRWITIDYELNEGMRGLTREVSVRLVGRLGKRYVFSYSRKVCVYNIMRVRLLEGDQRVV